MNHSFTRSQAEPGNALMEALPPLWNSCVIHSFPGRAWERGINEG
jgi:hypothetical protein